MNNKAREKLKNNTLEVFKSNPILCLEYSTGSGKGKISIDCIKSKYKQEDKIVIVTETIVNRKAYKEEVLKWWDDAPKIDYKTYAWYRRQRNYKDKLCHYDFVILDEAHHISDLFLKNAFDTPLTPSETFLPKHLILLSATLGKSNLELLEQYNIKPKVLKYTLKESTKDKITSEHVIIPKPIIANDEDKNEILSLYTNFKSYFGYNAQADAKLKGTIAKIKEKLVLDEIKKIQGKTLIYCVNIAQAKRVCKHSYHSKDRKKSEESLKLFCSGKINQLSCVNALDESANIPNIDNIIILAGDGSSRKYQQRVGRAVRFRKGHTGKVYYYYIKETIDEYWYKKHCVK